jgi:hypothetical protein
MRQAASQRAYRRLRGTPTPPQRCPARMGARMHLQVVQQPPQRRAAYTPIASLCAALPHSACAPLAAAAAPHVYLGWSRAKTRVRAGTARLQLGPAFRPTDRRPWVPRQRTLTKTEHANRRAVAGARMVIFKRPERSSSGDATSLVPVFSRLLGVPGLLTVTRPCIPLHLQSCSPRDRRSLGDREDARTGVPIPRARCAATARRTHSASSTSIGGPRGDWPPDGSLPRSGDMPDNCRQCVCV